MTESKLILAADYITMPDMINLLRRYRERLHAIKIHGIADSSSVRRICAILKRAGASRVWVDYKGHDTVDTVGFRARALYGVGTDILSVHIGDDGVSMIKAAKKSGIIVYAITVLTTVSDEKIRKTYNGMSRAELVFNRGLEALEGGADGIVCASAEAALFRADSRFASIPLIVPGTRLPGAATHDQQNVTTPGEAFHSGATKLVVGRDLTEAADPESILKQYEDAAFLATL